ncbi:MAG: hypothetical protein Q4G35_00120 [Propionibacteriaceae bacterium]|nr:hypothetical protein [Propionibacteriaceae bacterium]
MGLLRSLFGRWEPAAAETVGAPEPQEHIPPVFRVAALHAPLVQVAGTTTFCRDLASKLAEELLAEEGYAERLVTLEKHPADEHRPEAIDVLHESGQIGALPTSATHMLKVEFHVPVQVPAQFFASDTPKDPRLDAWVWLGQGKPEWKHSRQNRPPVTTFDRAAERHREIQALAWEGLADNDPHRQQQFGKGFVDGVHFLETVEPIKQLKREDRLADALALCYLAIQGAEQDPTRMGREPAPWYTIRAAIIHRKLEQHSEEIAVLQRWLDHCPAERQQSSEVWQRWSKLSGLPD